MTKKLEIRSVPFADSGIRALDKDGKSYFTGMACRYNVWSNPIMGCFEERLAPGCFDESLRDSSIDVYCSVDHDFNKVLGRVSAGTLKLDPRSDGIAVEVPAADYSYAKDLGIAIGRGDLRGMSFIFDVPPDGDQWSRGEQLPRRTVTKAKLYEVSFVYFPAYEQTSVGLRGIPVATPVAVEEEIKGRMWDALYRAELELRRKRLELLEKE